MCPRRAAIPGGPPERSSVTGTTWRWATLDRARTLSGVCGHDDKTRVTLQVSNHMATPEAQAEAKGQAQEDGLKSNAIPEVGLTF